MLVTRCGRLPISLHLPRAINAFTAARIMPVCKLAATWLALAAGAVLGAGCGGSSSVSAGSAARSASIMQVGRSASCLAAAFLFTARPTPKELSTPLQATVLASFAVFRRPELPSEEASPLSGAAGGLARELHKDYELSAFYPAYVRQFSVLAGDRGFLVVPGFGRPQAVPAAHCLPAARRRVLLEQERRRVVEPVYCILAVGGGARAPLPGCESFAEVGESSRAFHVSDFLGGEPTLELIPDGVSLVRVSYRDAAPMVVPVKENAFLLTPPPAPRDRLDAYLRGLLPRIAGEHVTKAQRVAATAEWNAAFPGTYPARVEWLDGVRRVVRTISAPTAKSAAAISVGDLRAPVEG